MEINTRSSLQINTTLILDYNLALTEAASAVSFSETPSSGRYRFEREKLERTSSYISPLLTTV